MRLRTVVGVLVVAAASSCAAQTPGALPAKIVTVFGHSQPPRISQALAPDRESLRPSRVSPAPLKINPDTDNPTGMLIEVSIAKQRLTAWNDGKVVMSWAISTGMPGYDTPTGHFHVIYKDEEAWSAKWGVVMPWALNFHGNYFLHQVTHHPNSTENIGVSKLGTRASHGCVREGIPSAERLYHWARVGTPVWIH
jgi:lipoprotein-anchoring transpeptidase ErfK/SrfK